jgi:hypothetical protein
MVSGLLRRVTALLVVVVTAATAACGGSPELTSNTTARQSTKTSTETGGGQPITTSGQTSSRSRETSGSGVRVLPCDEFINTQPPERDMRVILGVVALPTSPHLPRALQTTQSGLHDPTARLFAKWGLDIRVGGRLRLIVPERVRNQFSIGWGSGEGHRGTTIVVDDCTGPRHAKWLGYAGGYYVRDPLCAPLIVAAHRQLQRVRVGVGRACPGQRPPPEPTQG